ncbi:hypothetical protein [Coleofasciculus sp. H7-2]|uniref:hypothetical protein n=1 Tax=Coleofasciculus sp. H7-2 TaxID=3351545 RepID=UPI00366E5266
MAAWKFSLIGNNRVAGDRHARGTARSRVAPTCRASASIPILRLPFSYEKTRQVPGRRTLADKKLT